MTVLQSFIFLAKKYVYVIKMTRHADIYVQQEIPRTNHLISSIRHRPDWEMMHPPILLMQVFVVAVMLLLSCFLTTVGGLLLGHSPSATGRHTLMGGIYEVCH
jgi:hypothetical protein